MCPIRSRHDKLPLLVGLHQQIFDIFRLSFLYHKHNIHFPKDYFISPDCFLSHAGVQGTICYQQYPPFTYEAQPRPAVSVGGSLASHSLCPGCSGIPESMCRRNSHYSPFPDLLEPKTNTFSKPPNTNAVASHLKKPLVFLVQTLQSLRLCSTADCVLAMMMLPGSAEYPLKPTSGPGLQNGSLSLTFLAAPVSCSEN